MRRRSVVSPRAPAPLTSRQLCYSQGDFVTSSQGTLPNSSVMSSDSRSLTLRELQHKPEDLEILEQFYNDIYIAEFPIRDERESLQNMRNYLRLKASGWYGRNNYHILMGFAD